jgi:tetratricopeptide (TPR) repeat protein
VLAAVTFGVVACRRKHPYLLVGWLWYLGMLVPVLGIVQLALFPHADRYSYLPGVGLVMAGTWAVADLTAGWKHQRVVLGSLMMAAIGALSVCAYVQTSYWKDTESLWNHALACNPENNVARFSLANEFAMHGQLDQAIAQYRQALRTDPGNPVILESLNKALQLKKAKSGSLPP